MKVVIMNKVEYLQADFKAIQRSQKVGCGTKKVQSFSQEVTDQNPILIKSESLTLFTIGKQLWPSSG